VFNLGGEVRTGKPFTLFFTVRNLFNRGYVTAAQLGRTAFDAAGNFVARPFVGPTVDGERPLLSSTFYAPGAPRSIELGARLRF
jgi:outer membrane receptor protein involved in Fe transport